MCCTCSLRQPPTSGRSFSASSALVTGIFLLGDTRVGFLRAKHPTGKSQVGEMHRKPKAIRIPASLSYQRYILIENV